MKTYFEPMESFLTRYRNAMVLISLLLAQTIGLAIQLNRPADPLHPDGPRVRLLRLWALAAIVPAERVTTGAGNLLRNGWGNYVNLRHVRQQNAELQRQVANLRMEQKAMQEDVLEGRRLASILNFKRDYTGTTVVAQVIGTSGADSSGLLTLDKGARDGLRPDMAVITPDGIVGKLRDVFPSTSQLLLISDPSSGAGVILASTRIHTVVKGSVLGRLQILSLMPDNSIKPGETVMTSGGDRVFPRGLNVGTIESIVLDPEHQPYTAITIKPAVNLARLEEVLVITSFATQDESVPNPDSALPAGGTNAADISAERLPSLREEKRPAAEADQASPAPARLAPAPALHPDRYSPGAAPPAADLVPGQKGESQAPAPDGSAGEKAPSPAPPPGRER